MELLLEILFELVVGGSVEGASDESLPKSVRIVLLVFATLIYIVITLFFMWLLLSSESIILKVISTGVVLMFVGAFIFLWRRVVKVKN